MGFSIRRALRRTAQVVFCAAAIGAGASLAWLTRPTAAAAVGQFPPPMPSAIAALEHPEPAPEPTLDPEPEPEAAPEPTPTGTFAETLADGAVITGASANRIILFTFDDG
ncbi:MAG: hypothetical protein KC619_12420, partial [Myxococcales bacterium]|nr:hypothetical protein [Myxococcales bacterium]